MTINALRDMIHAVPFQPFSMRMGDGRSIAVPHPDFIALSGSQTAFVGSEEEDRFTIVDFRLVTQLEVGTGTSANH